MASLRNSGNGLKRRALAIDYQWQVVTVAIVGTFMVMLDATIVNVALPKIISVFHGTLDTSQLILTVYMLALAVSMPTAGFLSDTFGVKRMFLFAMGLFMLGSMLCGLAWDISSLVFFRMLQGLGGGILMPLGMTMILKAVPPEDRGKAMGVFGIPMLLGPLMGPLLGGYLVDKIDWRFIFYLNVPVGVLGIGLGAWLLRETDLLKGLRFDIMGFLLSALGFGCILMGLTNAPTDGWGSPQIVAYFFVGVGSLLLWVLVELDAETPLMELRVMKDRTYSVATIVNFVTTLAVFSSMFLLPLFLQNLKGLGAMQSGLMTMPQALGAGLMMPVSGALFNKLGPRPLIVIGLVIVFFATWQLASINLATGTGSILLVLLARGIGMGLITMPAMTAAMNTVPGPLMARASALTSVLRQIFSSFGTAIFATILQTRENFHVAMQSQTLTPDSPMIQNVVSGIQQLAMQHGFSAAQAKSTAIAALYQQVVTSAAVISFDDAFMIAAVITLVGLIPALLLTSTGIKQTKRGQAVELG